MTYRIAINGYGRIGRCVLRALYELHRENEFHIVAVNDPGNKDSLIHLTKYDTSHGRFAADIEAVEQGFTVNGRLIHIYQEVDPQQLPWGDLGIDLVLECSGKFNTRAAAAGHLLAAAGKVLVGAPAGADMDMTIVYGINHYLLDGSQQLLSNASCTTNCLAPIVKLINETVGIDAGMLTTVHAYTNDQVLIDVPHNDLYRARSATQSIIPTSTGSTDALAWVMPEMAGKITGYSMRVPTIDVSAVDLCLTVDKSISVEEINFLMQEAAGTQFQGILAYNEEPLVSIDYKHNSASAIFDARQTKVSGKLIKLVAWYDNEWGYANRLLDVAGVLKQQCEKTSSQRVAVEII